MLIWEQTVCTWRRGPQMVGYVLGHGPGALLILAPLILAACGLVVLVRMARELAHRRRVLRAFGIRRRVD